VNSPPSMPLARGLQAHRPDPHGASEAAKLHRCKLRLSLFISRYTRLIPDALEPARKQMDTWIVAQIAKETEADLAPGTGTGWNMVIDRFAFHGRQQALLVGDQGYFPDLLFTTTRYAASS
jgi:hypothetical protein